MFKLYCLQVLLISTYARSCSWKDEGNRRWLDGTAEVITCTTSISSGAASVTCQFPLNLAEKNRDFNLQYIRPNTTKEAVVFCNWIVVKDKPDCKVNTGYYLIENITDRFTVMVPPETLEGNGKYECQVIPPAPTNDTRPCDKDSTTTYTPSSDDTDLLRQRPIIIGLSVGLGVSFSIILALSGGIIYVYKRKTHSSLPDEES